LKTLRKSQIAFFSLAVLAGTASVRADYTWLGNDTNFGGDGTWDNATSQSWSTDGVSTTPVAWSPGNIAAFPSPAGTVTVSGSIIDVQGLKFSAGYTLTSGGTINFPTTASQTITIDNASNVSIAAVLGGGSTTSTINKTSAGTLTLSGNNTFSVVPSTTANPTSGFNVSAGTVEFTGDNSGVTGQFNTNASGATLAVGNDKALGNTNRIRFHVAGGVLRSTDTTKHILGNAFDIATSCTFGSSTPSINGDLEFTTSSFALGSAAKTLTVLNTTTLSGIATGGPSANDVTKAGAGTLVYSGANTYDRPTAITAGTLRVTGSGLVGSSTNSRTVTLGDNGLLDLLASGLSPNATLAITSTDSTAEMNLGVNDTVNTLVINGITMAPGVYGSTTSGAANPGLANPNDIFSGTGQLTVTAPEPGTAGIAVVAGLGLLAQRRRRRIV
jgi:MYXO-CTERM domain-containing protein